ncbi:MAG TPA: hypothetical protein VN664_11030 [Burkholderiales bacterium]|nr:hypothetical protein [Burkholderiales bacterium]
MVARDRRRRRGIFAIIRNRDDALHVVADAAMAFLGAAAVLVAMAFSHGWQDLADAALYVVLGALMWRFRSPAAAFALLLVAIMRFFITVGQTIETGAVNRIYVLVTVVVLFASIRAVEATLKLQGRFGVESGKVKEMKGESER